MIGSLVDSILGATIQSVDYCPICEKETEQHPQHHCDALTNQKRGLSCLNNDWGTVPAPSVEGLQDCCWPPWLINYYSEGLCRNPDFIYLPPVQRLRPVLPPLYPSQM
jgi:hypothetical protein